MTTLSGVCSLSPIRDQNNTTRPSLRRDVIWSAHLSMLFREYPYLERPKAAACFGFTAVETWWPPDELAAPWAAAVRRERLAVTCINADGGDMDAGERGFLNVRERRAEMLDAFQRAVGLAHACGASLINVLAGRELPGRTRSEQLHTVAAALADCAAVAEREGLTILVEPINDLDVPGYLVPTVDAACRLIEEVGSERVRLLFDAYHVARGGMEPRVVLTDCANLVEHVQWADCPGRGAPGTGSNDLALLLETLQRARYDGAIGLEFDPAGTTEAALESVPW